MAGLNYYHMGGINPKEVWDIGSKGKTVDSSGETLPLKDLPIVLFSNMNPSLRIPESLKRKLRIDILDTYRYHPRNAKN